MSKHSTTWVELSVFNKIFGTIGVFIIMTMGVVASTFYMGFIAKIVRIVFEFGYNLL